MPTAVTVSRDDAELVIEQVEVDLEAPPDAVRDQRGRETGGGDVGMLWEEDRLN